MCSGNERIPVFCLEDRKEALIMFILKEKDPIKLDEFLEDYNKASWLGYIRKDADCVGHGQWTVSRAILEDYSKKEDIYLAYNPLVSYVPRKKDNVGRLALLYVDLDIGRDDNPFLIGKEYDYKQETIDALEKEVFGITAPHPNYICDSGRGLYLIYKIYQNEKRTKQEHANAAKRWERINSYLASAYEWYSADRSVSTDEARVLRVPGSINSNSGTSVKYYKYSEKIYTLHNIEKEYMNKPSEAQIAKLERVEAAIGLKCKVRNKRSIRRFLESHEKEYRKCYNKKKPTDKQLQYAYDIARVLKIYCPNFRTSGGVNRYIQIHQKEFLCEKTKQKAHKTYLINENDKTIKMLEKRLKTIEKLLIEAPKDSYRETGLFLYRMFACQFTGNKEIAADMTRKLIHLMQNPLEETEAMRTTRTAEQYWEQNRAYKMSDKTLASWFGLTDDEWKSMMPKAIVNQDKKLRKSRNRRYYEKKLKEAGLVAKKDRIKVRREEMARLLSLGKNKKEICDALNISVRTYFEDLKIVKALIEEKKGEEQDIEDVCAKKLDALGNSGPIGPMGMSKLDILGHTMSSIMVYNPFGHYWMYSQEEKPGEWYSLASLECLNDDS